MWTQTYSKTFDTVSKEAVWHTWTDINNWPTWHDDLESCTLEGAFEVGSTFLLKPKNMSAVKVYITEINPGISFTDCTYFPGARMYNIHTIKDFDGDVQVENTTMVTGFLSWIWIKLVAQKVAASIPQEIDSLVYKAEQISSNIATL